MHTIDPQTQRLQLQARAGDDDAKRELMRLLTRRGLTAGAADAARVPWHVGNCPKKERDMIDWALRAEAWCKSIAGGGYGLRTHLRCKKCRFGFIYRTSNWSMSSSADVVNYAVCANPSCKHEWTERS